MNVNMPRGIFFFTFSPAATFLVASSLARAMISLTNWLATSSRRGSSRLGGSPSRGFSVSWALKERGKWIEFASWWVVYDAKRFGLTGRVDGEVAVEWMEGDIKGERKERTSALADIFTVDSFCGRYLHRRHLLLGYPRLVCFYLSHSFFHRLFSFNFSFLSPAFHFTNN